MRRPCHRSPLFKADLSQRLYFVYIHIYRVVLYYMKPSIDLCNKYELKDVLFVINMYTRGKDVRTVRIYMLDVRIYVDVRTHRTANDSSLIVLAYLIS